MPYIKAVSRTYLDERIEQLQPVNEGELNYVITRLIMQFMKRHGINYATMNIIAGVLQKVMAEFDRRVVGPYEDRKIALNGDVPEYEEFTKCLPPK